MFMFLSAPVMSELSQLHHHRPWCLVVCYLIRDCVCTDHLWWGDRNRATFMFTVCVCVCVMSVYWRLKPPISPLTLLLDSSSKMLSRPCSHWSTSTTGSTPVGWVLKVIQSVPLLSLCKPSRSEWWIITLRGSEVHERETDCSESWERLFSLGSF